MRHLKSSFLTGAALLALPLAAQAQPSGFFDNYRLAPRQTVTGLYIAAGAGLNLVENSSLRSSRRLAADLGALGIRGRGEAIFEPGFVGVGSIGWGFGNGLRLEVEGNYRENDIEKVSGFRGSDLRRERGTQSSYGVMGNLLYDFRIPGVPWFVPYIGGGVGYVWRNWDDVAAATPGGTSLRSRAIEGAFAWQAIGGAAFPIAAMPGLAVTAEYRYFGSEHTDFNTRVVNAAGVGIGGGQLRASDANHSVLLGVRYAFNTPRPAAPAPSPAPAAAPAPARTYLVFFDWDRAELTDRARQIIADAAANTRTVSSTRIEVSGHADLTGGAAYNQRLSLARAEAVAAELVRRGVARNEINVQGFGFTRPLVPTAMGVREPQNRRVEIVLR